MLNLIEEDKEIIKRLGYPKIVNLSCGNYLVKKVKIICGISELIISQFGSLMGLIVPTNHLIKLEDGYYILSADLNDLGKFIPAHQELQIDTDNSSLLDAWVLLEEKYGKASSLVGDIIKIYIFDVLFHNTDRRLDNWGFIDFGGGNKKVTMFDGEYILDYGATTTFLHAGEKYNIDPEKDFIEFLNTSSSEFIDLFKYYYDLFTPEFFKATLEEIIRNHSLEEIINDENTNIELYKNILVQQYLKNYQTLGEIYQKLITKVGDYNAR